MKKRLLWCLLFLSLSLTSQPVFAEETQRSPITGTRLYKNVYVQTPDLDSAIPETEERSLQPRFVTFGTVRPVIMKVAGISYILQLQLLLLLILRNMIDIILLFMRYRYEQKRKTNLVDRIGLPCSSGNCHRLSEIP